MKVSKGLPMPPVYGQDMPSPGRTDDLAQRRRRAIYRASYRGTKEMDWLLGKYGVAQVPSMSESELGTFEQLLALPDPGLQVWLMTGDRPVDGTWDAAFDPFIERIRAFHAAA